jgi:hypothetical protein
LSQLDAVLELHERVLTDLERRGVAIQERENEARRALEQVLAQCAIERTSIAQEKSVLAQAAELYRRFADASDRPASTNNLPAVAETVVIASVGKIDPIEPDILTSPQAEQEQSAEVQIAADSEIDAENAVRMHELCSDLRERIISSEAAEEEQKANKWTDSLRGLLNRDVAVAR